MPAEVGDVEMTALCYHSDSVLFSATSRGHVCVWHVVTRSCLMTWEADSGEIGMNRIYLLSGHLVWTQPYPVLDVGLIDCNVTRCSIGLN